jgi:hypothetical protein
MALWQMGQAREAGCSSSVAVQCNEALTLYEQRDSKSQTPRCLLENDSISTSRKVVGTRPGFLSLSTSAVGLDEPRLCCRLLSCVCCGRCGSQ